MGSHAGYLSGLIWLLFEVDIGLSASNSKNCCPLLKGEIMSNPRNGFTADTPAAVLTPGIAGDSMKSLPMTLKVSDSSESPKTIAVFSVVTPELGMPRFLEAASKQAEAMGAELSYDEREASFFIEGARVLHTHYGVARNTATIRYMHSYADSDEFDMRAFIEAVASNLGTGAHLGSNGEDYDLRDQCIVKEVSSLPDFTVSSDPDLFVKISKRVHSLRNVPSLSPNGEQLVFTDFSVEYVERTGQGKKDEDGHVEIVLPEKFRERYAFGDVNVAVQSRALTDDCFIKGYGYVTFDSSIEKPLVRTTKENAKPEIASCKRVLFLLANINGSVADQQSRHHGSISTRLSYAEMCQYIGWSPTSDAEGMKRISDFLSNLMAAFEATVSVRTEKVLRDVRSGKAFSWADSVSVVEDDGYGAIYASIFGADYDQFDMQDTRPDRAGAASKLRENGISPYHAASLVGLMRNLCQSLMNQKTKGLSLEDNNLAVTNTRDGKKALKFCGAEVQGANLRLMPMTAYMTQKLADEIAENLPFEVDGLTWDADAGQLFMTRNGLTTECDFLDTKYVPGFANGNLLVVRKHCIIGSSFRETLGGADFDGDAGSVRSHQRGNVLSMVRYPIGPNEIFRIQKSSSLIYINRKSGLMELECPWDANGKLRTKKFEFDNSVSLRSVPVESLDEYLSQRTNAFWTMNELGINIGTVVNCIYSQFWYSETPVVLKNEEFLDAFLNFELNVDQLTELAEWVENHKARKGCNAGRLLFSQNEKHEYQVFKHIAISHYRVAMEKREELDRELFGYTAMMESRLEFASKYPKVQELTTLVKNAIFRDFRNAQEKLKSGNVNTWLAAQKVAVDSAELAIGENCSSSAVNMAALIGLSMSANQLNLNEETLEKLWKTVFTEYNPCYKTVDPKLPWKTMNADHPAIVGLIELSKLS